MKNKRAICITIICVLGVLILLLLLFSHLNHGNLYNGNQAIATGNQNNEPELSQGEYAVIPR